ncbi:MAG: methionyl-tRNA formyltransferase [Candidatus Parcubacteria bacterium]|nr:MAG: methionyl-tRNA formyltransferase [Candidatus Parcubacteria bacterium]
MTKKLDFCFLGSSEFSIYCLKEIIKEYIPSLIITLPAKRRGRGLKLQPNQVYTFCLKNKLNVIELNDWLAFNNLYFKFGLIAGFGKVIPKEILKNFNNQILNIHPSLLPKYRGANPIRETILNGDKETGVTIILIDELVDHGPIIAQEKIILTGNETYIELQAILGKLGGKLFNKIILDYFNNKIELKTQDHGQATWTRKINKNDGLLNIEESFVIWDRKIRALNPWPGTFMKINLKHEEKILKIFKIEKIISKDKELENLKIGEFFRYKNELGIKILDSYIIIKELQLQDRKKMSSKEFLNGYSLEWLKII